MKRPAVFIDRDGTLMKDSGYPRTKADVHLLPGAADAILLLQSVGYLRVVITNQSGIGRGLLSEADFEEVQTELESQLSEAGGARIDRAYHCPHIESDKCECRKPGLALYLRAVKELDIDLATSWCVGDKLSDLLPAQSLGTRACLVLTGEGSQHQVAAQNAGYHIEENLLAAVTKRILPT